MSEKQITTSRDSSSSSMPLGEGGMVLSSTSASHSVHTTRDHVNEALDKRLGSFVEEVLGNIEHIKETGGEYRRVWLLRHFPIKDADTTYMIPGDTSTSYAELSSGKKDLTEEQIEWIKMKGKELQVDSGDLHHRATIQAICRKTVTGKNTTLYSDKEYQEKDGEKVLQDGVPIAQIQPRNRFTTEYVGRLENCDIKRENLYVEKETTIGKTIVITGKMVESFFVPKSKEYPMGLLDLNGDTIILGNRSHAPQFAERANRISDSTLDSFEHFAEKGYDYLDFNSKGEEVLPSKNTLIVTPDNYESILKLLCTFCTTEEGKKQLQKYFESLPLVSLQEAVNTALTKLRSEEGGTGVFRKFLESCIQARVKQYGTGNEEPDFDLQWYALEGMIELGVGPEELIGLTDTWNKTVVKRSSKEGYRAFVLKYYGGRKTQPIKDYFLFPRNKYSDWRIDGLFEDVNMYWKICELQRRSSLDTMIQEGTEGGILERKIQFHNNEENGEAGDFWERKKAEEKRKSSDDYDKILQNIKYKKYLLRAHVGEGKSLWLTEFAKYAIIRGLRVEYYKAKELNLSLFEKGGEIYNLRQANPDIIFCFDGIDEIPLDDREEIKEAIAAFKGNCLVAARTSEYPNESDEYSILSLKPIDSNQFLISRYTKDVRGEREKLQTLLEKNGLDKEIQNNPLLLTMIVLLAKKEEEELSQKELSKYEKYNIRPLSKIKNKQELYESVASFILVKHANKERGCTKDDLLRWMKELGEYAHQLSQCSQNDLERRLRDRGIYDYMGPYNDSFPRLSVNKGEAYREHLPLLYRIGEMECYDFIHSSFYDFFLAMFFYKERIGEFPHQIGENTKKFYIEMHKSAGENGNKHFINVGENFWNGYKDILCGIEKDLAVVDLYNRELLEQDLLVIMMKIKEMRRENGGEFTENDIFDNLIRTIVKKQQEEPCSFASLMPHIWYDFLGLEKLNAINTLLFFPTLLNTVPTDATLRALPEELFKEFSTFIKDFHSTMKGSERGKEVTKKLEKGFEHLHRNIAKIGTPYARDILKRIFSVSKGYNTDIGRTIFLSGSKLVQEWFLSELTDLQKGEFFSDLIIDRREKNRGGRLLEIIQMYAAPYIWNIGENPGAYNDLYYSIHFPSLIKFCIENDWISDYSKLLDYFIGNDIIQRNRECCWITVFLCDLLNSHNTRPLDTEILKRLLSYAKAYLDGPNGKNLRNGPTRNILCTLSKLTIPLKKEEDFELTSHSLHESSKQELHELMTRFKYSSQETVFSVDFMPKEYELEHLSETGDKELQEKILSFTKLVLFMDAEGYNPIDIVGIHTNLLKNGFPIERIHELIDFMIVVANNSEHAKDYLYYLYHIVTPKDYTKYSLWEISSDKREEIKSVI